ncbi:NADH-quinone oxidoreductase subunit C [Insolitispirillum peregrinum]|uniref:NADH-quinone oxidoreductase subunit C n=1 Tax=Insolitispirillum peregrinum TaxID=80876 RepID=A0A1N7IKL9_9PROT|nr:NADH-quinone oxidoreductase subunit C [Insolitispirillum peregrinum]SIS37628.1 NADH dehydrogenase subunit C [Insolitispirillum peregrinum]
MKLTEDQVQALRDLGDHVAAIMPHDVIKTELAKQELIVTVQRGSIVKVLTTLRDDVNCKFSQLVELTAVDYPEREQRFDVVYCLLSMKHNQRVRVKLATDEATPVPTVTGVFSTAGWFEREVWDMYGVFFADHPDLRRILTDYGFEGHPLRKDFPLTGYVEMRYDEDQKRIVYEPVKLAQDFRSFDFLSPWEAMTSRWLPGDEKAAQQAEGKK